MLLPLDRNESHMAGQVPVTTRETTTRNAEGEATGEDEVAQRQPPPAVYGGDQHDDCEQRDDRDQQPPQRVETGRDAANERFEGSLYTRLRHGDCADESEGYSAAEQQHHICRAPRAGLVRLRGEQECA